MLLCLLPYSVLLVFVVLFYYFKERCTSSLMEHPVSPRCNRPTTKNVQPTLLAHIAKDSIPSTSFAVPPARVHMVAMLFFLSVARPLLHPGLTPVHLSLSGSPPQGPLLSPYRLLGGGETSSPIIPPWDLACHPTSTWALARPLPVPGPTRPPSCLPPLHGTTHRPRPAPGHPPTPGPPAPALRQQARWIVPPTAATPTKDKQRLRMHVTRPYREVLFVLPEIQDLPDCPF